MREVERGMGHFTDAAPAAAGVGGYRNWLLPGSKYRQECQRLQIRLAQACYSRDCLLQSGELRESLAVLFRQCAAHGVACTQIVLRFYA